MMFFQIEALLFQSEKCMVYLFTSSFLFGYQEHLLSSAFSAYSVVLNHAKICLISTRHHLDRKPKYLKMCRMYAQ